MVVQPQAPNQPGSPATRPWTPFSVAVLSFLLPAGGAILTIRNLQRLQQLDRRQAKYLVIAASVILAIGLGFLFALAKVDRHGLPQVDPGTSFIVAAGIAITSFVVQRAPFRSWAQRHKPLLTGSWTRAVLTALLYQVIISFAAAIAYVTLIALR